MAARTPRVRRQRSLTESLLTIVLTLEAILVFFITLTVYGLHALSPAVTFGGGAALFVVLLVATRLTRYSWGVWVGWVLQLLILSTGLLLPALYIVAILFIIIWIYCYVRGRQIDRANHSSEVRPNQSPSNDGPSKENP